MKFLFKIASLGLLTLITSGCFVQQELPVEYDYSYRGRFEKYDTYDFMIQTRNTYINDKLKNTITSSIASHMEFLGYKQKEKRPDILLSFSVFVDSLNLRGYEQPEMEEWVKKKDRDLEYNKVNFSIKQGTLYIQLVDRKQNLAIWQGFATDKYSSVDLEDSRDVQNAVKSILNKYQVFSQEFIKREKELRKQNRSSS